jgi:diguanylate cyclase (GGDEF)-like protein/PAS domain S-box-containing protein
MVDITEQMELRDRLDSQRRRLRNIIDSTRLGTWEWNIPSGQTIFNERWASMLGYSLAELEPTTIETWKRLTLPEDLEMSTTLLSKHFSGETEYYEFEGRMRHRNGQIVWVLDRGKVIERNEHGEAMRMFGTHQDITEKKEMEARIRELSIRDPLTGIFNRRSIFEKLEALVSQSARDGMDFCVSMLDLDNFKSINDRYGHAFGDEVLKSFTGIILAAIKPEDALGRYGGEEFILLSICTKANEVLALAERLIKQIQAKEFSCDGESVRFGFSCGIVESSEFSRNHLHVESLLALADKRMYEAKSAGRGRVVGPG